MGLNSNKDINMVLPPNMDLREIGSQAVWSLSSCKPGHGVAQLRDENPETFWQSDGPQPHSVSIQFRKKTPLVALAIYSDCKLDESYTPQKISIRSGSHFNDLQESQVVEVQEPTGWFVVELGRSHLSRNSDENSTCHRRPLRTFMLQVVVLMNHQNGRDTHIRQMKVFAPADKLASKKTLTELSGFSTAEMKQYCSLR